jgi:hypothetical protein
MGAKGERTCASSEKTFRSDASDASHRRDARRSLLSPLPLLLLLLLLLRGRNDRAGAIM